MIADAAVEEEEEDEEEEEAVVEDPQASDTVSARINQNNAVGVVVAPSDIVLFNQLFSDVLMSPTSTQSGIPKLLHGMAHNNWRK